MKWRPEIHPAVRALSAPPAASRSGRPRAAAAAYATGQPDMPEARHRRPVQASRSARTIPRTRDAVNLHIFAGRQAAIRMHRAALHHTAGIYVFVRNAAQPYGIIHHPAALPFLVIPAAIAQGFKPA